MLILKSGKKEGQNCLEHSCTHHEILQDKFDESRNFDLKLNDLARYGYQSIHFELLRLILGNTFQNQCNLLQDDVLHHPH